MLMNWSDLEVGDELRISSGFKNIIREQWNNKSWLERDCLTIREIFISDGEINIWFKESFGMWRISYGGKYIGIGSHSYEQDVFEIAKIKQ